MSQNEEAAAPDATAPSSSPAQTKAPTIDQEEEGTAATHATAPPPSTSSSLTPNEAFSISTQENQPISSTPPPPAMAVDLSKVCSLQLRHYLDILSAANIIFFSKQDPGRTPTGSKLTFVGLCSL